MRLRSKASINPTDYQSKHLAIGLSRNSPAFTTFSVDSLGRGRLDCNPVMGGGTSDTLVPGLELKDDLTYTIDGYPVWRVTCDECSLILRSEFVPEVEIPPFTLRFNQKTNHATLLGMMEPGDRLMSMPCVLHMPDMGSLRITCNTPGVKLDYDSRRWVEPGPFVDIAFPPANVANPHVEYRLNVVAIHPQLPRHANKPLYDGFRRDWLSIFQINPRLQMLANNSSSDACAFTLFEYSEVALHTPPLADGLTCLDLIRMSLDRYLAGQLGYGQVGYADNGESGHPCEPSGADLNPWGTPWTSLDTLPSLLISACNYVKGTGDEDWVRANYQALAAWAHEMLEADRNGNGLVEYPGTGNLGDRPTRSRRPSNWWDTINFGHEDAFSNALVYRAIILFEALTRQLGHGRAADFFSDKAAALRAAYVPTLLNPESGVLAGWKSADGELHDYWFTYVQGLAISYGLVDDSTANTIMDRMLAKMREVGFESFTLGLPGNLIPVKKGDYVDHEGAPEAHGVPQRNDGSDGFQFYENGGTSGCWVYYTLKALYQLDRVDDARRIFHPMLEGYANGEFQGFGENGMSRDWRDWSGGCHGYEGLLVDNYLTLLAVLDDAQTP